MNDEEAQVGWDDDGYLDIDECHAEVKRLHVKLADACAVQDALVQERNGLEKSRQFFIDIAEARDRNLAQSRAELKGLQGANRELVQQLAGMTGNRDYWHETCLATEAERSELRKKAQAQADLDAKPIEITGQEMVEALQTATQARKITETAAHILSKAIDECMQTVHTERALRQVAETGERAVRKMLARKRQLLRGLAQRATRAEALAQLVTPELATLLERLAMDTDAVKSNAFDAPRASRARTLAARIREALDDNKA